MSEWYSGKSGLVKSGQVKSGQVKCGQVKSGQVKSGQVKSGQVKSGQSKCIWEWSLTLALAQLVSFVVKNLEVKFCKFHRLIDFPQGIFWAPLKKIFLKGRRMILCYNWTYCALCPPLLSYISTLLLKPHCRIYSRPPSYCFSCHHFISRYWLFNHALHFIFTYHSLDMLGYSNMLWYVMSCYIMLCYVMLWYFMSCYHGMLCYCQAHPQLQLELSWVIKS